MNKLIITLWLISIPAFSLGQGIIVQSTNKKDIQLFELYKKSPEINSAIGKLKEVMNKNPDYSGKDMNIVIKITFYNPDFITLKLKRTEAYSDDIFNIWSDFVSDTGNKITLSFDFEEKSNNYVFKDFKYTEEGGNEQVPELVANYIKEEILVKENNKKEEIVKKGINAVKNAFDRRFQQQMIANVAPLLPQKKYYKGYSYGGFNWFNFEVIDNQNKLPYNLETLYQKDENSNYTVLPTHSVKSLLENKNTVFTFYDGEYKNIGETEVSTKGESIYYEETNLLAASDRNKIYAPAKTEILSNIYTFKEWKYIKKGSKITLVYSFDDIEKALSQQHKIKVITGAVPIEGEVDEYIGLSVYGNTRFSFNQPTWCNQFAKDVTENTYLKNDVILRDATAEGMNKDFNAKTDKYAKLPQDVNGSIWTQYINKGFLVFFSTTDHIEVGFPDNIHYENHRDRHSEDIRYSDSHKIDQTKMEQLTIGAGSNVGYKLATKWATAINKKGETKTQAFIYLEYLKF
jgi:hypothetical protein